MPRPVSWNRSFRRLLTPSLSLIVKAPERLLHVVSGLTASSDSLVAVRDEPIGERSRSGIHGLAASGIDVQRPRSCFSVDCHRDTSRIGHSGDNRYERNQYNTPQTNGSCR